LGGCPPPRVYIPEVVYNLLSKKKHFSLFENQNTIKKGPGPWVSLLLPPNKCGPLSLKMGLYKRGKKERETDAIGNIEKALENSKRRDET